MGRPKGTTNKVTCPECGGRHLAGAPCRDPETDTRPLLADEYRLNILDHRIHGLHEVLLDLKYNPNFALVNGGRNAYSIVARLEAAYQELYDTLAAELKSEDK